MTDPKSTDPHPYCWHRIFYAFLRWTIPACVVAICSALPLILNR